MAAALTASKHTVDNNTEMALLDQAKRDKPDLGRLRQLDAVKRVPAGLGDVRFADRNMYVPEPSFIARTVGQTQRRVR
jgi:hypothetical protein